MRARYTYHGRPTSFSGPVWPLGCAFILRLMLIIVAFGWPLALPLPRALDWVLEAVWLTLVIGSLWVIRVAHGR